MDQKIQQDLYHGRRHILKGIAGLGIGIALLSIGALERLFLFFSGPRMSAQQESALIEQRLEKNVETAGIEGLEIERLSNEYLLVAKLSDLKPHTGVYFYDYQMRPALAFVSKNGLPLLISAKCTHLGCTVGNTVDEHNQILCPCHLSLFNIETGQPSRGPSVQPLPRLGWIIKDSTGRIVASQSPGGAITGKLEETKIHSYTVFIAKKFREESA
jgi:Rieske Fe-S protein